MKKIFSYIFILVISFFITINNVDAIQFKKTTKINNGKIYYDSKLNFSKNKSESYNHSSLMKVYRINENSKWHYAYCSDMKKNFYKDMGDSIYAVDTTYDSTKCKYRIPEKDANGKITGWSDLKYDGDCSSIVGYIIKNAYTKGGSDDFKKYAYAQASVWAYLGGYAYTEGDSYYLKKNNKEANVFSENSDIENIIKNAWAEYKKDHPDGKVETMENDETLLQELPTNKKFYYIAQKDECGKLGGEYRTDEIKITNSQSESIAVTITPLGTGYTIHYKGIDNNWIEKKVQFTIELAPGETLNFYLTSTSYIEKADIEIYAETKKLSQSSQQTGETYTVYDSKRYKNVTYDGQGLIYLTSKEMNTTITTYTGRKDSEKITFYQDQIKTKTTTSDKKTDASGKCANLTNGGQSTELYQTICKTINLGNDSFVRIILKQTVKMKYGYLYPSNVVDPTKESLVVFSGGSFKLNEDKNKGKITEYAVSITWDFADWINEKPYYYNKQNPSITDASGLVDRINEQLLNGSDGIKEKYKSLKLNIETYDSNKLAANGQGELTNEYKLELYNDSIDKNETLSFNGKEINLKYSKIQLKKYKMTSIEDGSKGEKVNNNRFVTYGDGEYRAYFVPMYYPTGTFDFNISDSDLSVISEMSLIYDAKCEIEVENRFKAENLRYRSISVENPFPTGTLANNMADASGIPLNWKKWYYNTANNRINQTNKERIEKTFENNYIYKITLNNEKMQEINEFNKKSLYTQWKNINSNGTSDLVLNLFDDYPLLSDNSYCEYGSFKESCNK